MNGKGTYIISAAVAACIGLLLLIAPANGANIVIGGDYTDVGTIVFVSPKSGDEETANGTALLNTLTGITDASETNLYLIKLGPGIYDLGATSLQMKQYVSIEGSGEKATKITAAVSTGWPLTQAAVLGADNAELRYLTVENAGASSYSVGILNNSVTSLSLIHVTAAASGGTYHYGIYNLFSSPTMTNVTATASGAGVHSIGILNDASSSPTMTDVTATASGAGATYGVFNGSCSPVMKNVTASASGGTNNYGVNNTNASPTMTNVTATSSGGTDNRGVNNDNSSVPTLTNVTASASGGTSSYGVYNTNSSPTMTNVTATASGGSTSNYGVYSKTSGTVKINHSVIAGATFAIYNEAVAVVTRVGDTQLTGAVSIPPGGTLTCFGVYDGNYNAYPCP